MMNARFSFDESQPQDGVSADQTELLRLVRAIRQELSMRIPEVGCMNPEEFRDFLWAWDQAIDLHVAASLHDDRITFVREKLQRMIWSSE